MGLVGATAAWVRWGGEEFVIVTPQTSLASAQELADRIRAVIGDHAFAPACSLSASFGVAACRPNDDKGTLFKRADLALYAKHLGKNRVEVERVA